MRKLNVLVAGSTGYIGVQLINLLVKHSGVKIKYLCGNSSVGKNISSYDRSLSSSKLPKIIRYNKSLLKNIDLVFTALPNGEAQNISNHLLEHNVLIDLAADFRLNKASDYLKWYKQKHKSIKNIKKSIYLLPEINGNKINSICRKIDIKATNFQDFTFTLYKLFIISKPIEKDYRDFLNNIKKKI